MSSAKREELLRDLREAEVPWDDLRALRVQRSTWKAFLSLRNDAAAPAPSRKRAAWILSGALAAAAIVALWFGRAHLESRALEAKLPAAATLPAARTMSFDTGSTGVLAPGAEVRIIEQEPQRFGVSQLAGSVQYDIRHDPSRAFVVRVADVTVAVLGTRFSVELGVSTVKVSVESGRVRVSGGGRSAEVVTGESVTVQAFHPGAPPSDSPGDVQAEDLVEEAPSPSNRAAPKSPAASPSASPPATVEELLAQADAARAGGRSDEAARALRTLLAKYPNSAQSRNAWFTLARVERGRGNHAAAAQAFARCAAFGGTLAGEATAEEAASWLSAGRKDRAKSTAERYLRHYPSGAHAAKMRAILE